MRCEFNSIDILCVNYYEKMWFSAGIVTAWTQTIVQTSSSANI